MLCGRLCACIFLFFSFPFTFVHLIVYFPLASTLRSIFAWMKHTLTHTISSCHAITSPSVMAGKLRRGHIGRRALCWAIFDITLDWSSATLRRGGADLILSLATQMSCDGYQTSSRESRGAPVSKGPPLALQPSSLAASVSWHQKAFEHWLLVLNESSSRSSALTDGFKGASRCFAKPVIHLWISRYLDQMDARRMRFLVSMETGNCRKVSVSLAQTLQRDTRWFLYDEVKYR